VWPGKEEHPGLPEDVGKEGIASDRAKEVVMRGTQRLGKVRQQQKGKDEKPGG